MSRRFRVEGNELVTEIRPDARAEVGEARIALSSEDPDALNREAIVKFRGLIAKHGLDGSVHADSTFGGGVPGRSIIQARGPVDALRLLVGDVYAAVEAWSGEFLAPAFEPFADLA